MYDLIVLGGGPAGGHAAETAAEKGLKTLLIEERALGGVCLNEGCIPSKALLYCSGLYHKAQASESFGIQAAGVGFDLAVAMKRKNALVEKIRKASESSKKKRKIPVVFEHGVCRGTTGESFRIEAGETTYDASRLLISTGSEAIRIPIPGADKPWVMTNREILDIDHIPENLVIIGGGVIGLEFATLFSEIGSSVTVVEMLPAIGGSLDEALRSVLQKELEKKGITFLVETQAQEIGDHQVVVEKANGETLSVPADNVLMSTGRRPRTGGIGLETLSVEIQRHAVVVDDCGRTNAANVYAAGDVNGKSMLAHTASREADVCIDTILGSRNRMRYEAIPMVIYTHPEVAWVGPTLQQARDWGYDAIETSLPLAYSGRYLAETNNGRGMVKVVVDRDDGTIRGIHMIGGECSEMIPAAVVMVESELRIRDVRDMVFPHPTVAETIKDAVTSIVP